MSQVIHSTGGPAGDRAATNATLSAGRGGVRRWAPPIVTVVVLGWSIVELITLVQRGHTIGPELYGILVAALAVGAGALSLVLLASPHRRTVAATAVVILWAVVALGGIAGSVAHAMGPVPGHGPVDDRPRPAAAPLVFTALGLAGGGALVYGSRRRAGQGPES
jgi:4-amino-4-deoxy-L-arabinose transferase-like glycosyltransferase